jgi:transcriptional regulator with XRE-family HTH domain
MHALRQYIQDQLDERGWERADLMRRSGLSRQQVHRLLTDDRPRLPEIPDETTIMGLANAFGPRSLVDIQRAIIEAIGLGQAEDRVRVDVRYAGNNDLIEELRARLTYHAGVAPKGETVRLKPTSFTDARSLGAWVRHGYDVEFDLGGASDSDGKRLIDFAAGLALAMGAKLERVQGRRFRIAHHGPLPTVVEAATEDVLVDEPDDEDLQIAAHRSVEPAGYPESEQP